MRGFFIPDFLPKLIRGTGDSPEEGGCVMQVVCYLTEGEWTDSPKCVHPALRDMAISVNDEATNAERQSLWPLIPRLINTNFIPKTKEERRQNDEIFAACEDSLDEEGYNVAALRRALDQYDEITGRNKKFTSVPKRKILQLVGRMTKES